MSPVYRTKNKLLWLKECRARNKNAMANTATGEWLKVACQIIEQQFHTIQKIRNEQIDETYESMMGDEA